MADKYAKFNPKPLTPEEAAKFKAEYLKASCGGRSEKTVRFLDRLQTVVQCLAFTLVVIVLTAVVFGLAAVAAYYFPNL